MARSYALQLLLAIVVFHLASRLLNKPRRTILLAAYSLTSSLLLYTHYASGASVIAGVAVYLLFRRRFRAVFLSAFLQGLFYAPWMDCFARSLERAALHQPHQLGSFAVDQAIRLGYWYVAFVAGETPPLWALAVCALLAPAVGVLLWGGLRRGAPWSPFAAIAAAIGFLGVSRWVAFAFIPARMLFLLPFFVLVLTAEQVRGRLRAAVVACWMCLSAASLTNYYRLDGFLNKGYLIPFDAIASEIHGPTAAVIIEYDGLDAGLLLSHLAGRVPILRCPASDAGSTIASARTRFPRHTIWYIRRGGGPRLAGANRVTGFVAYSGTDRRAMRLLGWRIIPTHVIELIEFRP